MSLLCKECGWFIVRRKNENLAAYMRKVFEILVRFKGVTFAHRPSVGSERGTQSPFAGYESIDGKLFVRRNGNQNSSVAGDAIFVVDNGYRRLFSPPIDLSFAYNK
jgi:hypothetical protein